MVAELRWILLGFSALLLAGIWWWGARRSRHAADDSGLRETTQDRGAGGEDSPYRSTEPPREWGVPPFEPLSIHTADFDQVQLLDLPVMVAADPAPGPEHVPESNYVPARPPSLDATVAPAAQAAVDTSQPRETQRVVTVRVSAIDDSRWAGADLKAALEQHGLSFGRYKVFHRLHNDGRSLFCAASLVEPGTFDLARMPDEAYRGVTLFAVLPGPAESLQTIDALIATAGDLAATLQGQVQDAQGAPMTLERAAALRADVSRFQALPTVT